VVLKSALRSPYLWQQQFLSLIYSCILQAHGLWLACSHKACPCGCFIRAQTSSGVRFISRRCSQSLSVDKFCGGGSREPQPSPSLPILCLAISRRWAVEPSSCRTWSYAELQWRRCCPRFAAARSGGARRVCKELGFLTFPILAGCL